MIKNLRHSVELQFSDFISSEAGHSLLTPKTPLLQVRLQVRTPSPHVTEQEPVSSHSTNTAKAYFYFRNNS